MPPRGRSAVRPGTALAGTLTRTRILQGAAAVLACKGLAATTVEDILHAAGVSRRTFYQWFANIEEVLEGLYDLASGLLVDSVRAAARSRSDPVEGLDAAVSAYLELQRGVGPLAAVLHAEAMRPESRLAARREAAIEAFIALYEDGLRREGRHVDPLIFRALALAAEGITVYLHRNGEFTDATVARARRVLLALIERVLAPDEGAVVPLPQAGAGARSGRHRR